MIAFLLSYWKVLLPAAVILALGIDDGVHRIALANLRAAQAQEVADAEAKVRAALQADQEMSNKLVADYAGEIAGLQGKLQDALTVQAKAAPTPLCDHSPAAIAFDRSLRQRDQAAARQPGAAR